MPYPAGNPFANQKKSDSQPPMFQMTTAIAAAFPVDHVDFDNGVNNGKHKQIRFPGQNTSVAPTGGDILLYTNITPPPDFQIGSPSLVIQKTGGAQVPITRNLKSLTSTFIYLPCGILLKTQVDSVDANAGNQYDWITANGVTITKSFSLTNPPFTAIQAVYLTALSPYTGSPVDPNVVCQLIDFSNTGYRFHLARRITGSLTVLSDVINIQVLAFGTV